MPRKVKKQPVGRPMSYENIAKALDPHTLYSAASIASFAEKEGFIKARSQREVKAAKLRIKVSFNRLAHVRHFPKEGDGNVVIKGQAPITGWFGKRWQDFYQKPQIKGGKEAIIKLHAIRNYLRNIEET